MNKLLKPSNYFIWILCCLFSTFSLQGQDSIEDLKSRLGKTHGKAKLLLLNQLTELCLAEQRTRPAVNYANRAAKFAENIIKKSNKLITSDDYYLKPQAYLNLGKAYQQYGRYVESREAFDKAIIAAEEFGLAELKQQANEHLAELGDLAEEKPPKKRLLDGVLKDISSKANKTSLDFGASASIKLAKISESKGNYFKAIRHYRNAINRLRDKGDSQRVGELQEKVADLFVIQGDIGEATRILNRIKQQKEESNRPIEARRIQEVIEKINEKKSPSNVSTSPNIAKTRTKVKPIRKPETKRKSPPVLQMPQEFKKKEQEIAKAEAEATDVRSIAEQAESSKDYETSLIYFKKYAEMEKKLMEEKQAQELALLEIVDQEREITLLKQTESINELKIKQNEAELKRQILFKQGLGLGFVLLASILSMLYLLYRNKKREHQKLNTAYKSLETAQNQLKEAEERIKNLLHQHVSKAVANELLASKGDQKVEKRFVCVLFLDICNFTPFVEKLTPEEIIDYQNNVFGFMMEVITKRKGIVNQIMGDGFMATFGAPVSAGNDCREAYLAAREIMNMVNEKSENGEIPPTKIRMGLHAGHVVTGNVGTKNRKQFSVTGNAVIIAARLEQLNKEYGSTLMISKEVYQNLPEGIQVPIDFNEVVVKGRSKPIEVAAFY